MSKEFYEVGNWKDVASNVVDTMKENGELKAENMLLKLAIDNYKDAMKHMYRLDTIGEIKQCINEMIEAGNGI